MRLERRVATLGQGGAVMIDANGSVLLLVPIFVAIVAGGIGFLIEKENR